MAGCIPIILIGNKLDLKEQTVPNNEIYDYVEKNQLHGIFFTTVEEKNHIEIFRHLLESIMFTHIYQLNIPLPEYDYEFENFIELFSVCPICQRRNHYRELKELYFSRKPTVVKLRDRLLELVKRTKAYKNRYKMRVGIPCCRCFKLVSDGSN